jgi:hypothetical protein
MSQPPREKWELGQRQLSTAPPPVAGWFCVVRCGGRRCETTTWHLDSEAVRIKETNWGLGGFGKNSVRQRPMSGFGSQSIFTFFYGHARRHRLEKPLLFYLELFRSFNRLFLF